MSVTDDNTDSRELKACKQPSVSSCPECGGTVLSGVAVEHTECLLKMDDGGQVDERDSLETFDTLWYSLRCATCNESLIEEGEKVHDAVKSKDGTQL